MEIATLPITLAPLTLGDLVEFISNGWGWSFQREYLKCPSCQLILNDSMSLTDGKDKEEVSGKWKACPVAH